MNQEFATTTPIEPAGPPPLGVTATALSVLMVALWGGTPVAIKYSVVVLPPIAVAGIRFGLAAVFMLFWCRVTGHGLRLQKGQVLPTVVLGLLLFVQISLFHVGVQQSNSSHSTLLINTFVFWVAGIEHFITRTDRLSPLRFAGLAIAAAGVALLLSATGRAESTAAASLTVDAPTLGGDFLVMLSASLLAVKIIYTKQAVKAVEPGKLIFWHDVVGVILFTAATLLFEDPHLQTITDFSQPDALPAIGGLLYQGLVVAGFCFAMQAYLLRRYSASQISVFAFATPLFGIVFAVLLRGDPLSPWLFAAGMLVAVGIGLVNRLPRRSD